MATGSVESFKKNGYCKVKSGISKEICDLVSQYALFDEIQDFHTDGCQVPNAHAKYADPLMESILLKLLPKMELSTGLGLYPTYSFYRVYRNGDILSPHTDRPSCEISATLNFGFNSNNWPIFMNGKEIFLDQGEMAIYRGCDIEHWRQELSADEDAWHVQGFFHFVDKDGPFAKYIYDERSSIGALQNHFTNKKYIIKVL